MPELRPAPAPPPAELRRLLRDALGALVPGWHPLAEDVLGEEERIDWVGRDRHGRAVAVLVGRADGDLALVARGLAQLAWVAARTADWAQLAPDAGLRPEAGASVWLLAPRFGAAAQAAVRAAGAPLRLAQLRFVANGAGTGLWLEPLGDGATDPADASGFRTGLGPEDLDLTPEERAEFADLPENGRRG